MPTFAFPYTPQFLAEWLRRQWNAPLPHFRAQNFGGILDARLLSTLCRSTSELLRTL